MLFLAWTTYVNRRILACLLLIPCIINIIIYQTLSIVSTDFDSNISMMISSLFTLAKQTNGSRRQKFIQHEK